MTLRRGRRDAPVRWSADAGAWEMRCASCATGKGRMFWPLTHDYWDVARGLQRCRACIHADMRARAARKYRASAAFREAKRQRQRAEREAMTPAQRQVMDRKRYEARKEQLARMDEVGLARVREAASERQRRYRARQREQAA